MKNPDILLISLMNWSLNEAFILKYGIKSTDAFKQLTALGGDVQLATDLTRNSDAPVEYLESIFRCLLEDKPFMTQNTRTALLLSLWVHRQLGRRLNPDQIEAVIRTLKYSKSSTEQKLSMLLIGLAP